MHIRIAKNKRLIEMGKAAGIARRRARRAGITSEIENPRFVYKKIYFYKILALASRVPFEPKKVHYTMFYDSLMDTAGLTECVPENEELEVNKEDILDSLYDMDSFDKKKENFLEKHILRKYLIKRPELKIMGVEEIYLPYWFCRFPTDSKKEFLLINAATGRVNI